MKNFILNHKKLAIGLAIALVVLVGAGIAVGLLSSSETQSTSANDSYTVQLGNIESTVSGKGYIEAGQEIKVAAPVGVTVKEVLVEEGDAVGAGQALANIEPASIAGKLAEAVDAETNIQSQLNGTNLTTYEREALTGQRTEIRNYISQLRDLRNYPVITAPQNGVIQKIYLIDGEPIDLSNTLPSASDSSNSSSGSSNSNVNFFQPKTQTYPSVSVAEMDAPNITRIAPISYMGGGLIMLPLCHFLNINLNSTYQNTVISQNQQLNLHDDIIQLSDSNKTPTVERDENSDLFSEEDTYINGRSNFIPDTSTSNVDQALLEKYMAELQNSTASAENSNGETGF